MEYSQKSRRRGSVRSTQPAFSPAPRTAPAFDRVNPQTVTRETAGRGRSLWDARLLKLLPCRANRHLATPSRAVAWSRSRRPARKALPRAPRLSYLTLNISLLSMLYVYLVPWSEFPIVPSYPHYPHERHLLDRKFDSTPSPSYQLLRLCGVATGRNQSLLFSSALQGYLAHKKTHPPLGPP